MAPRALTILTRYADEVGRNATVTIQTGTDPGDDNYGPDVLVDDNPAKVAKIDSTTGAWLLDFGAPQRVDLAALIHHDFDEGSGSPSATVLLEANTTNSWPGVFQALFTIPAWRASGTTRAWPVNPWLDLTEVNGYSATGWRFWRLSVVDNSQNLQLGNLKLYSQFLRFEADFREGLTRATRKRSIVNSTAFGIDTIYARGTNLWEQSGALMLTTAQAEEIEAHHFDADGQALPFVVVPNGLRNNCYFARRTDEHTEAVQFYNEADDDELITMTLPLREVGRGLRPGV